MAQDLKQRAIALLSERNLELGQLWGDLKARQDDPEKRFLERKITLATRILVMLQNDSKELIEEIKYYLGCTHPEYPTPKEVEDVLNKLIK